MGDSDLKLGLPFSPGGTSPYHPRGAGATSSWQVGVQCEAGLARLNSGAQGGKGSRDGAFEEGLKDGSPFQTEDTA